MKCKTPCCYVHHPKFIEELEDFVNKHSVGGTLTESLQNIERLLTKHFSLNLLQFTPKHIGIAQGFSGFTVYWLHFVIPNSNVSRTQLPKAYFLKFGSHLSFLCLDTHIKNYKDSKLRKIAVKRVMEIIEVVKTHN